MLSSHRNSKDGIVAEALHPALTCAPWITGDSVSAVLTKPFFVTLNPIKQSHHLQHLPVWSNCPRRCTAF